MRVRKDPAERRRELMAAAQALFEANGYGRTTVQDICQRAGVAKGTFFYYFATKEAMLGRFSRSGRSSSPRRTAGRRPV